MINAPLAISSQDTRRISVDKLMPLGSLAFTRDGRGYRYGQAGATALAAGKLAVNADADTNAVNKTVARTTAAGELTVIVDAGGTIVADAYADGSFNISDATGEGINYLVASNTGVTGAGEITLQLTEPIKVGLTIDVSEYSLFKNPWDDAVISAADQADMPVGVPNVSITALYYGWFQVSGVCAVLADEATARGQALTIGSSTAGSVEALDAAGEPQVGIAKETHVDTEYMDCYLTLP